MLIDPVSPHVAIPCTLQILSTTIVGMLMPKDRSKFHKDLHTQPLAEPTHFCVFSLIYLRT